MNHVVSTNKKQLTSVNTKALLGEITPAGISLCAVRTFIASNFQSRKRLKAIAALRAKSIQSNTSTKSIGNSFFHCQFVNEFALSKIPNVNPIMANGKANTV